MMARSSSKVARLSRLFSLAASREGIAVFVAIGLSLVIITTIYSNIRSVEKSLPQYGFVSFRALHAHISDINRLKNMVLLSRADPISVESRALLSQASDLAYIRFAKVDRTQLTTELNIYVTLRESVLSIVRSLDTMLVRNVPLDQGVLKVLAAELEEIEIELNRLYYRVGEDSSEGLHQAQLSLGTLNAQILVILAVLSTLLIGVAVLLVQRQRASKKLRALAWHDAVTGLKNRAWLMDKSAAIFLDAGTTNKLLAIYLIDLDHFKQVNDTFGHQAGDDLLRLVANVLKSHNVHRSAAAIRLGGDEFALVKAAESRHELIHLGETLCSQLSGFREIDSHQIKLAASVGLSICPDHGRTIDDLLRSADLALYSAKADGRQRLMTYSPELKTHLDNRVAMEENIRQGIQNDEFFLVWQPQLSVATGQLAGAEALLRWKEPATGAIIQPSDFIPIAELSDLIEEIDRMVLRKACLAAASWVQNLSGEFTVSVNISGRQLADTTLPTFLSSLSTETGLPLTFLELDLTEHGLSWNEANALSVLSEIRRLGVRVAIDDFGTGHSSLSSIANMEIDRIKIDRSFLFQLEDMPRKHGLVNSILTMCDALDMQALAKGVETAGQLEYLAGTSCAYAQGFYLCEPLSASLFSRYLEEHRTGRVMHSPRQMTLGKQEAV